MPKDKTLAWMGGSIVAGLIAIGLASAKKPEVQEKVYSVSISNINSEVR